MNPAAKGRGIARGRSFPVPTAPRPLRQPGNLDNGIQNEKAGISVEDSFGHICKKLSDLDLYSSTDSQLSTIVNETKSLCKSVDDLNAIVDVAYNFCLKSKVNAHVGAMLCSSLGDFEVNHTKFKPVLLRKIQSDYEARNKIYGNREQFVMNVTVLCEIFHHMRLPDGSCYIVLVSPIIDYFNMLLDGASETEVEVFAEQVKKCYADLRTHNTEAMDDMLVKIREKIISKSVPDSLRATLLKTLEQVLTDWNPLSENVECFYQRHAKSVVKICE